jgi:hypothetical protein
MLRIQDYLSFALKKLRHNAPVEFRFSIHSGNLDPVQSNYQEDLHGAIVLQGMTQCKVVWVLAVHLHEILSQNYLFLTVL